MDFPVRHSEPVSTPPGLAEALGVVPIEVFADAFNYLAFLESAQVVRELAPDIAAICGMDRSVEGDHLPAGPRLHRTGRHLRLLPGRVGGYLRMFTGPANAQLTTWT